MKSRTFSLIVCCLGLIPLLLLAGHSLAKDKKAKPQVCSNPHPEQLCSAANTCGSSGSPCLLEIKRTGGGVDASVTPNIPNFPKDSVICVNTGTSVTCKELARTPESFPRRVACLSSIAAET